MQKAEADLSKYDPGGLLDSHPKISDPWVVGAVAKVLGEAVVERHVLVVGVEGLHDLEVVEEADTGEEVPEVAAVEGDRGTFGEVGLSISHPHPTTRWPAAGEPGA